MKQGIDYKYLQFDKSYKVAVDELALKESRYLTSRCEVEKFVLYPDILAARQLLVESELVRQENFEKLIACCKLLKIKNICIRKNELVTDQAYEVSSWPGVWRLKDILNNGSIYGGMNKSCSVGFSAGCGNSNQSQIQHTSKFLPPEVIDKAFCVDTKEELPLEPFRRYFVCR